MLSNAKSIEEIDNLKMKEETWRISEISVEYFISKFEESMGSEVVRSFVAGSPVQVLKRLVEFRSCGPQFMLDNLHSNPSWIYSRMLVSLGCMMFNSVALCDHYLHSGGVQLSISELRSREFLDRRHARKQDSLCAKSIGDHLALLYNTSTKVALKSQLGEVLRACDFYAALEPFALSLYDSFLLLAAPLSLPSFFLSYFHIFPPFSRHSNFTILLVHPTKKRTGISIRLYFPKHSYPWRIHYSPTAVDNV